MALPPIVIDASDLKRQAAALRNGPKAVEIAMVRAINRGGDGGTTAARKALREQTGIKDRDTRRSRGLTTKRAKQSDPSFELMARSRWTPLGYFNPRQTKAGVRASPWSRSQVFARTFLVRMGTGYTGVFQRDVTAARQSYVTRGGKQKSRPALRQLWGPSLAKELERGKVPTAFADRAREVIANRLPHELEFALGKIAPRPRRPR